MNMLLKRKFDFASANPKATGLVVNQFSLYIIIESFIKQKSIMQAPPLNPNPFDINHTHLAQNHTHSIQSHTHLVLG